MSTETTHPEDVTAEQLRDELTSASAAERDALAVYQSAFRATNAAREARDAALDSLADASDATFHGVVVQALHRQLREAEKLERAATSAHRSAKARLREARDAMSLCRICGSPEYSRGLCLDCYRCND